jgi:hypothetical protein
MTNDRVQADPRIPCTLFIGPHALPVKCSSKDVPAAGEPGSGNGSEVDS